LLPFTARVWRRAPIRPLEIKVKRTDLNERKPNSAVELK
jgi:hypothetical protein